MKDTLKPDKSYQFEEILEILEIKNSKSHNSQQKKGIVYTPLKLADFLTKNILKFYLVDLLNDFLFENYEKSILFSDLLQLLSSLKDEEKGIIWEKIAFLRILDPSCGSGRFLITIAENLLILFKILKPEYLNEDLKEHILKNNIFGVEIDKFAVSVSKLRLLAWFIRDLNNKQKIEVKFDKIEKEISKISNHLNLKLNICNQDFLLEYGLKEFNIILGNPPYVENKKMKNVEYKKKLKKFNTAYGLYDLSILFVEKSLDILHPRFGYLSFIITNKFLAADYGKKIRKKLINESQILEIYDISSLQVFKSTATYPIIISLTKNKHNSKIIIKILDSDADPTMLNIANMKTFYIKQNRIQKFPSYVLPISQDMKLINRVCSNYENLASVFDDLDILYRPFGFIKWADNFVFIKNKKRSDQDLILLGTGNVGKFHIKFDKAIRIANKQINLSYFNYNSQFDQIWPKLTSQKLLIREIAKEITVTYDPGLYANLTGVYSIVIPSFTTDQYFCLLTILNSILMNKIFSGLYGTLHMAGGYLRYNGSFIKRLPMPPSMPISLGYIGKIIQFLSQLKYEQQNSKSLKKFDINKISNLIVFFYNLSNEMVEHLYLEHSNRKEIAKLLNSNDNFPKVNFKYFLPRFNLSRYQCYNLDELENTINKINDFYYKCYYNKDLLEEISISSQFLSKN